MVRTKTQIMVECALLVALAVLLGMIPVFSMPFGGSITVGAMAPLVIASLRHGVRWGLMAGVAYGVVDGLRGMKNIMYADTPLGMAGVALLDYVVAYAVIGLVCVFAALISNRLLGAVAGAVSAGVLRLLCHFISGIIIWGAYAPEGTPVWYYSLTYNAGYMIPEIIITAVVTGVVAKVFDKKFFAHNAV